MSRLQRRRLKEPGWIAETSKFPVIMWEDEKNAAGGRANINFSCFVPTNEGSVYGNCVFKVDFCLIPEFPRKSPSLAFVPAIFHSNVEESAGSICWDATGPGWVASQVLHHVVEFDLPFLLDNPNHRDPHNLEAARMAEENDEEYKARCALSGIQHAIRRLDTAEPREKLFEPFSAEEIARITKGRPYRFAEAVPLPRPHIRRREETKASKTQRSSKRRGAE